MTDQMTFALRVCGCTVAFLISAMLSKDAFSRIKSRETKTLAFALVISSAGLSYGTLMALTWNTVYFFTTIAGRPADWMLSSAFIMCYTALMFISAMGLMRALTVSWSKALFCFSMTILSGVLAYVWVGYYL